jgi:hypothetical protein
MWRIEYDPTQQILTLRLSREMREVDMRALARSHALALEATGGQAFRVFADLRGLHPLDADAAAIFMDMKRIAARLSGYLGRAVLVDSATVAMQQHNARVETGDESPELITLDPEEATKFIRHLI